MDRPGADSEEARRTKTRRPVYEAAGQFRRALHVRTLTQREVDDLLTELRMKSQRTGFDDR